METLFVGRQAELEAILEAARSAVRERRPVALLVVGAAGHGKSRLVREALANLTFPHVFPVTGYEPERHVPLAAASELLRALSPHLSLPAQLNTEADPAEARLLDPIRIFEVAHTALGSRLPAIIALDDLQWADDLSVGLCHYLLRAAAAKRWPVVLLVAARPSAALGALIDTLGRMPELARDPQVLELGPLAREDAIDLVRWIAPHLDENRADDLWRGAAGSPFWIKLLASGGEHGIPVDEVVGARLRGLDPEAAHALGGLAVAGRPVALRELGDALGLPAVELRIAVDDLVRRGLAVAGGDGVRVVHDLVRDAVERTLPAEARRRLHLQMAIRLEAEAGDDVRLLREALEHRRAAELPALDLALRISRSPQRRWLGSDGLRELLAFADTAPASDPQAIALRVEVAVLASDLGERELALREWGRIARDHPDREQRQRAAIAAGREAHALGRLGEARDLIAHARESGQIMASSRLAIDALEAAILLWLEHRTIDGRLLADATVVVAREASAAAGGPERLDSATRRAYLQALTAAFDGATQSADPQAMLATADEMLDVARGFDDEAHFEAVLDAGFTLQSFDRSGEAEPRLRQGWDEARRAVLPAAAVALGFALAGTLYELGRLEEAEAVAVEALGLQRRIRGFSLRRRGPRMPHSWLGIVRGDWRAAVQTLAIESRSEPDPHYRLAYEKMMAIATARIAGPGSAREVREYLAAAEQDATDARCPRCSAELQIVRAEALARIGDVDGARIALAARSLMAAPSGSVGSLSMRRAEGLIAAAEGDARRAAELLGGAADEAERREWRMSALWIRLDLGRALMAEDPAAAREVFERALGLARRCGSPTLRGLAERELRLMGVRVRTRRCARGESQDSLSPRELELARLVAGGATNPEIAERLFLSRKTVERHVSNILAKVGARNRTELAARLLSLPNQGGSPGR